MNSAFWDSSALIPLCVVEPTTVSTQRLAARYEQIVWWGSTVEVRSAIARRSRSGALDAVNRDVAIRRLESLAQMWNEIVPEIDLRELAGNLLDQYPLRAADSLQLAAALVWCSRRPAGRVFICSDLRLGEAAELAGFTVVRP